jgi:putative ABC transport system permease protein
MMISENVKMALASIRSARLRSFFTMLGIIIAVVSVVTIVSLGEGVKKRVLGQISHAGNSVITVKPGKLVNRSVNGEIQSINLLAPQTTSTITDKDIESITNTDGVQAVAPMSFVSGVAKANGSTFNDGVVIATSNQYPRVTSQKVEFGSFFTSDESDNRSIVVGAGVAEKLFKEFVPIGSTVKIRDQSFIVKGVFERLPSDPTAGGINYNNALFITRDAAKTISENQPAVYQVLVQPSPTTNASELTSRVNERLMSNHDGAVDFTVLSPEETVAVTNNVLDIITTATAVIAIISLLVGGVSIMNVMLVSVSERSREIGIRKAIGATDRQIRQQFLIESAVLSIWGALVGILVAVTINIALLVSTNLQPVITWQPVVIAVVVSISVGIVFGVVPAIKASKKDPIEALRPN